MSNRSGTPYSAPTDANRRPVVLGVSTVDGITPVPIEVDPVSGKLQVSSSGSGTTNTNLTQINGNTVLTAANGLQEVALNDGTNTANVVAGDSGFNGVAVASGVKQYTFTTSVSGAQTLLANTPTEGYTWIEVEYSSVGSGLAIGGQYASTSGGTYANIGATWTNTTTASPNSTLGTTVNYVYGTKVFGNYFQLNVTALTSGTLTGTVTLRAIAPPILYINAVEAGTWTVGSNSATGSAIPSNAFPMGANGGGNLITIKSADGGDSQATGILAAVPYVWNGTNQDRARSASAASNTTGTGLLGTGILGFDGTNYQRLQVDANNNLKIAVNASATGAFSYSHISTATTTTIKSGAGTLHNISVNTKGTVASTITVYDNTAGSGTVIGVIDSLNLFGSFILDIAFTTGLTIVTTGTVAPDITVAWK